MKKYYFYLEPYTFFWQKNGKALIYNSLTYKMVEIVNDPIFKHIFESWHDPENMNTAVITDIELKNSKLQDLVKKVRDLFAGDILDLDFVKSRPVFLKPLLSIQDPLIRFRKDNNKPFGTNILDYLWGVDIHLSSQCRQNCKYCDIYYKQLSFCTRNKNFLNIDHIVSLLRSLKSCYIKYINFISTEGTQIDSLLLNELNEINTNKKLTLHYLNIDIDKPLLKLTLISNFEIVVLVTFPIDYIFLSKVITFLKINNLKHSCLFPITSLEEYFSIERYIEENGLNAVDLKPVYVRENISFFKENVYYNKKNFNEICCSRKDIYANQTINVNDFGKLNILSDGNVYANINHPPIGKVSEGIQKLVYNEIKKGISWFRIRDKKPCDSCVYQWLCPSPSNYELAIGKPNLCHIK